MVPPLFPHCARSSVYFCCCLFVRSACWVELSFWDQPLGPRVPLCPQMGKLFSNMVKMLLEMSMSACLGASVSPTSHLSFLPVCALQAAGAGWRRLLIPKRDLDFIPGSWLWPHPAHTAGLAHKILWSKLSELRSASSPKARLGIINKMFGWSLTSLVRGIVQMKQW